MVRCVKFFVRTGMESTTQCGIVRDGRQVEDWEGSKPRRRKRRAWQSVDRRSEEPSEDRKSAVPGPAKAQESSTSRPTPVRGKTNLAVSGVDLSGASSKDEESDFILVKKSPVSPRAINTHTSKLLNATQAALSRNLSAAASALNNAETPDKEVDKITLEYSIMCDVLIFSKWTWKLVHVEPRKEP